jgi:hypothetical protein
LKFKMYSFFMVTAHEPLQLDKWNLVLCVVMDISSNFIWIVVLFDVDDVKFWGYIGTNTEPLCWIL